MHSSKNVLFGWLAHGVLLIIGKDHHILTLVAKVLRKISSHVADIVDAASELTALVEVVDSNEKGFSPAGAVRVSEVVAIGSAMTELLGCCRRRSRATWLELADTAQVGRERIVCNVPPGREP
jgi:hypothetical protein